MIHPTDSELHRFAAGELDDDRFEEIAAHIETCELCSAVLEKTGAFPKLDSRLSLRESPKSPRDHSPQQTATHPSISEGPGSIVGPYKLLQQLGEGGMGVVYMAEQEKPVRRKVALKIIKPGMDSQQVIARFEAERQALAMMDHHNIAKVLDAGTTETGRPYFAMELVKGVPITDYCDKNKLTPRERLELFIPVCQAIQHAHQKGIIHRDIKPTNVLLTLYDGKPVPKVIDFGIAKATEQKLTERTMFTGIGQILGTLEYMSPEQAEMNQLDIDTRSDVYSLGVMLYELLTGSTPITKEKLKNVGFEEMLRTIRETEPPKPSTRLSDSGEALPSISAVRKTEPGKLSKLVRGDLDWIVMKALEKDRTRRYETANGLSADVQRFLDDDAVTACPPSARYKFQKFARRNKTAIITGGAIAALLVAATITSVSLAVWAMRAEEASTKNASKATKAAADEKIAREKAQENERVATREAIKSREVATFLKDMLKGVGPSFALGRDTTMLQEILDKTAERLKIDLENQPEVQLDLRKTLTDVYRDLGSLKDAEQMMRDALRDSEENVGIDHIDNATLLDQLASILDARDKTAEAEQAIRLAIQIKSATLPQTAPELARSFGILASILTGIGRGEDAEALLKEQLAIHKQQEVENEGTIRLLESWRDILHPSARFRTSVQLSRDIIAAYVRRNGEHSADVASAYQRLGNILLTNRRFDDADLAFEKSIEIARRLKDSVELLAGCVYNLGVSKHYQFADDEAKPLIEEALSLRRSLPGAASWTVAHGTILLSTVSLRLGDYDNAVEQCQQAYQCAIQLWGPDSSQLYSFLNRLAEVNYEIGRIEDAEKYRRKGVEVIRSAYGEEHRMYGKANWLLANVLRDLQRYDEAESLFRRVPKIYKNTLQTDSATFLVLRDLQEMMIEIGNQDEADKLRDELIALGSSSDVESASLGYILDRNDAAHHHLVENILNDSDHLINASNARRAARAALLNPTLPLHLVKLASKAADRSLKLETQSSTQRERASCHLVVGLANYRNGKTECGVRITGEKHQSLGRPTYVLSDFASVL